MFFAGHRLIGSGSGIWGCGAANISSGLAVLARLVKVSN